MASRAKEFLFGMVAAALVTGGAATLMAQGMPTKIDDKPKAVAAAKERSTYMTMLAENEKHLVSVIKGQAPLDAKAVAAAEKIHTSTSPKELLAHFAPGTGEGMVDGSRARATIWSEWDKFAQMAAAVQPAAAQALAAAKAGDQATFNEKEQATVNACSACHKVYRAPRQR